MSLIRSTLVASTLAVLVLAGCNAQARNDSAGCDGISTEVGGCDPGRPSFTATTCDGVAVEVGRQLDRRITPIFTGPAIVNGSGRSVQIANAESLTASVVSLYLRGIALHGQCDLDAFLTTAETQFSDGLRKTVGQFAYDGHPVLTYEQWRAELRQILAVIDDANVSPS